MSKFLFIVLPAYGHLNPTLSVACELKKRGHEVAYATGADVQGAIEREGFSYFKAGPPGMSQPSETMKRALKMQGLLSNLFFVRAMVEHNVQMIDDLKEILSSYKPDIIMTDTMTFAGGSIAEYSGLPWAACSAVPGLIPSKDIPPYTHWGLPPSKSPLVKSFYEVIRFFQGLFFRLFDKQFNKSRCALGLKPLPKAIIQTTLSPYLLLLFTHEGLEYKRSDWPPQAYLTGPSPWGKEIDNNDFAWIDSLPKDKPVIYITLGTVQSYRSTTFFRKAIEAFTNQPYLVAMSVSRAVPLEAFKDAPSNFIIRQFIPNQKILKHASAIVHHAGFSLSHDAILNGLPAVVLPVNQDLVETAQRCIEAGVAVKLNFASVTPLQLLSAVRHVLTDAAIQKNTKTLQQAFLQTDAGRTGADLLEKLAQTKKPVYRV